MKTINLLGPYGFTLEITTVGSGSITSDLGRETCEYCGQEDCVYSCDQSTESLDEDGDVIGRLKFNGAMDGLESLILAAACEGIDVESPAFKAAIETAVDSCSNNM